MVFHTGVLISPLAASQKIPNIWYFLAGTCTKCCASSYRWPAEDITVLKKIDPVVAGAWLLIFAFVVGFWVAVGGAAWHFIEFVTTR